ncbi:hypothetical protein STRTUCAR8_09408 [Streptomyces turgidiscabies Car8]|uniref:Uncharacterized protein n=1 Tax=Streptomyces turgidiscabies (strain Car8) TaxID=698760 RepID=L7F3F1_STRT8|nr:hypothetical protein STRTUCAR8_09408 [Streptomyces turgidiscabies Car8]
MGTFGTMDLRFHGVSRLFANPGKLCCTARPASPTMPV